MLKLRLAMLGVRVADAALARINTLELILPDESWCASVSNPARR